MAEQVKAMAQINDCTKDEGHLDLVFFLALNRPRRVRRASLPMRAQ